MAVKIKIILCKQEKSRWRKSICKKYIVPMFIKTNPTIDGYYIDEKVREIVWFYRGENFASPDTQANRDLLDWLLHRDEEKRPKGTVAK